VLVSAVLAACRPTPAAQEPARAPALVNSARQDAPAATGSEGTPSVGCCDAAPARAIKTVFVIVMENHNWSAIKGSPSAPFINQTLLPMASYAEAYFNPPHEHPSESDYLWLEGGTTFGRKTDAEPDHNHIASRAHLTALLDAAGVSWRSYQEGIDGTACPLHARGNYVPRHQAFVYFDDVTDAGDVHSPNCIAHIRPFAELARDLERDAVARYNFITPDLCHDMHDVCPPLRDRVQQGDAWLASEVPTLLASRAYKDGGAIFITWDEATTGDGPIGMIVLSPAAKGNGYASHVRTSHSSMLRTLEEILAVTPLLGDAASAVDLSDLFARFP
jgi:hypothetical protein